MPPSLRPRAGFADSCLQEFVGHQAATTVWRFARIRRIIARHASSQTGAVERLLAERSPCRGTAAKVWTPDELFRRNTGTRNQEQRVPAARDDRQPRLRRHANAGVVPDHHAQGHILINSDYERNVRPIRASIDRGLQVRRRQNSSRQPRARGITWKATRSSSELTAATVMAMAEDVPALEKMTPAQVDPIDRILHDGDEVKLAGMTLVADLTPRSHARLQT